MIMHWTRSIVCIGFVCYIIAEIVCQNEVEPDINKLSRANAFFADRLYKQLSKNSPNVIFSPLSISVALSMLSVGAGGTTYEEINSTLGFQFAQLNEQELQEGYQTVMTRLAESRDDYQFNLATAQFFQDSFPIHSNYTREIAEDFGAESRPVDFSNAIATLQEINEWIRNATHGKIDGILEDVDSNAVMALVNAVHFKASWINRFKENSTARTNFHTESGASKQIDMMIDDFRVRFNARHPVGGSVLELPYKTNAFTMIFVLPRREESLTSLEEGINPEVLLGLHEDLTEQTVHVGIPKIKLDSTFDLIAHLEEIGITEVFTDSADLSRISPEPLQVSQARHRSSMELSEEGCEASSATAEVAHARRGRRTFWANRPFMFLLRHVQTNTICFMGRVSDV